MGNQVVIVGGGVIGLSCAYYLQMDGWQVTVIDRGKISDGTSFGNAGYVSPSHFIPLASPGIVSKGLRWMLSSSSPFYIKPRLNADLIRWALTFWRNANEKTMRRNIPPLYAILQLSRDLMSEIKSDLGNHFRMAEVGCLMLYKSAATEKYELNLAAEAFKLGIETKLLSGRQVQELEPEVEVKVRGAVLYPVDCHLHPGDFMQTLKKNLMERGVRMQLETEVIGFEKNGSTVKTVLTAKGSFHCDELIMATGSWLPLLMAQLGIPLLMQAGKGYSITYEGMQRNLHHPAILVDDRVAMTPMGNDLRMGGTMEISGINQKIILKRVEAIFKASRNYYPDLNLNFPSVEKIWTGLRPLSPDGLPYIGRAGKYKNLVVAGGHAMLGLSLAAATGKLVAELLGRRQPSIDLGAFEVGRYHRNPVS